MALLGGLEECPDELLLQIFELLISRDLCSIVASSRRLRSVGLDDKLWSMHCDAILNICPSDFDHRGSMDARKWGVQSYFEFYLGLRRWEPYLGWWIPHPKTDEEEEFAFPFRLATDMRSGCLVGSWMHFQRVPDHTHQPLPGSQLLRLDWGTQIMVDDPFANATHLSTAIAVQDVTYMPLKEFPIALDGDLPPIRIHSKRRTQNWPEWNLFQPRNLGHSPSRLFPSPSMLPALRDASIDALGNLLCARAEYSPNLSTSNPTSNGSSIPFIPVHPPSSPAWKSSLRDPVDSGLYLASFGAHGTELLMVTFRTLTETDFKWDYEGAQAVPNEPWPWDIHLSSADPHSHFGPFSRPRSRRLSVRSETSRRARTSCGSVRSEHVVPGRRIMEVTKLIGDPNVPAGQRSLIVFLDIPREETTSADMMRRNRIIEELEQQASASGRTFDESILSSPAYATLTVLPRQSTRPPLVPWPIALPRPSTSSSPSSPSSPTPDHARIMTPKERMEAGTGWTVHGIGHISDTGFHNPSWSPAIVHFASREEFQVLWLEMVMTFTKLR